MTAVLMGIIVFMFIFLSRRPTEIHCSLTNSKTLKTLPAHAVVTNQALVYKAAANNVAWVW